MKHSRNRFIYLRIVCIFLFFLFVAAARAQGDGTLLVKGQTSAHTRKKGLGGNVGVKAVDYKDDPLEGVSIEVRKDGATILKTTSGKKGKYSFEIPVSISDAKNDYMVLVTKDGMAPIMIYINSYLPKDEFKKFPGPKYELEYDFPLLATTVTGIELDKPSAKIVWDKVKEHKFTVDQAYYTKYVRGDEQKMLANTDLYFTTLAKKKKKAEDALLAKKAAADAKAKALADAKLKAEEEAKRKADEEAQRLAAIKAKEEADRIQREKDEIARQEALKKHIADSIALAQAQRKKNDGNVPKTNPEPEEIVKTPLPEKIADKDSYDVSETYSINLARRSLSAEKQRRSREKGKNLSAKYETFNILTSLLDVVDENDKKAKRQ